MNNEFLRLSYLNTIHYKDLKHELKLYEKPINGLSKIAHLIIANSPFFHLFLLLAV